MNIPKILLARPGRLSQKMLVAVGAIACLASTLTGVTVANAATVGGVVNTYYDVATVGAGTVNLGAATAGAGHSLQPGDNVVLMQMTGTVASGLGVFEMLEVDSVSGSTVTLASGPDRTYDTGQAVQLIHLPYDAAGITVNSTVTPVPWNGNLGGVAAMGGSTVTLGADIDTSGAGYTSTNGPGAGTNGNSAPGSGNPDYAVGGAGGGGGLFGGGGGGGGHNNATFHAGDSTGGGGGSVGGGGGGGVTSGASGGAPGGIGNGGGSYVQAITDNTPGSGGGGGGGYGGGGGTCGFIYSSAYSAGGGGGGSYNGGGAGGLGGTNTRLPNWGSPNDNQAGQNGNSAASSALPLEGSVAGQHYFHTDDARLMMGGAGGNSAVPAAGPGGAGGGIVILDTSSVVGAGHVITADGVAGGRPATGPSAGAGGGGGGQILITASTMSGLFVTAKGGDGGTNRAGGTLHAGSPGASGGGGGIWFQNAVADGTNSGSDVGATSADVPSGAAVSIAGVTWDVGPGTVNVDPSSLRPTAAGPGSSTPVHFDGYRLDIDVNGNPRTVNYEIATGYIRDAAGNAYLGGSGPGGELVWNVDFGYYDGQGRPINPKNPGYGCLAAGGGIGLVRASTPPGFDVSIAKDVVGYTPAGRMRLGTEVTFSITVTNDVEAGDGSRDLTSVVVTDFVDTDNFTFEVADQGPVATPGDVNWAGPDTTPSYTIASLPEGTSTTLQIVLRVKAGFTSPLSNVTEVVDFADPTGNGSYSDASLPEEDSTVQGDGSGTDDDDDRVEMIVDVPYLRAGDLVWLDVDDDGIPDDGEPGIAHVLVELWRESGTVAGFDAATDTLVDSTATDVEGMYAFDTLREDIVYYVAIPSDQSSQSLVVDGYVVDPATLASSTGGNTANNDVDNVDDGEPVPSFMSVTGAIDVTVGSEATGEVDANSDPDRDAEVYVEGLGGLGMADLDDADSNLTVDLGLTQSTRVGNLVWLDGVVGDAGFNNGVADSGELGIGGVSVELWLDDDDGAFDPDKDTLADTTTTSSTGAYWFDDVAPGSYMVAIPAGQTGQNVGLTPADLADLSSSSGQSGADVGVDDVDDGDLDGGYVSVSEVFDVDLGDSPDDELGDLADATPGAAEVAANVATSFFADSSSDLTVDLSFVEIPLYQIGNLVWLDIDDDGVAENGEPGIGGVHVELWQSGGLAPYAETDTDVDGHYWFPDLPAGDYSIVIPGGQTGQTAGLSSFDLTDTFVSTIGRSPTPTIRAMSTTTATAPEPRARSMSPSAEISVGDPDLYDPTEPTDETLRDDLATDDDGVVVADDQSNVTLDVGFVQPLRIGNLVWLDDGAGTDADEDDGQADAARGRAGRRARAAARRPGRRGGRDGHRCRRPVRVRRPPLRRLPDRHPLRPEPGARAAGRHRSRRARRPPVVHRRLGHARDDR